MNFDLVVQNNFENLDSLGDLNNAVEIRKRALESTSPNNEIALTRHLTNLGYVLHARYHRTMAKADLNIADELKRNSVSIIPNDQHGNCAIRLRNRGSSSLCHQVEPGQ